METSEELVLNSIATINNLSYYNIKSSAITRTQLAIAECEYFSCVGNMFLNIYLGGNWMWWLLWGDDKVMVLVLQPWWVSLRPTTWKVWRRPPGCMVTSPVRRLSETSWSNTKVCIHTLCPVGLFEFWTVVWIQSLLCSTLFLSNLCGLSVVLTRKFSKWKVQNATKN